MKRLLLLFAVTFAFATTIFSQEFFGGLILGGTTSQIAGDNRGGFNKVGIVGGAFAGLNLSHDFDVQMELKFIQKGSRSTDIDNRPQYDPFLIQLNYIDLPIVFSYNLNKININDVNLKWLKFELGLSLDILVKARQEIQGVPVISNPWNRLAANTIIGVRASVSDNIEIGLRTVNSITSVCSSMKDPFNNGNVRYVRRLFPYYGMFNDVLQLSIFWKI